MENGKVIFLITCGPFETLHNYESLRTSIALFYHEVHIIWIENGVFSTLKNNDRTLVEPFLRHVDDLEVSLYVSESDLTEIGFNKEDVFEGIMPLNDASLIELISDAKTVISF